MADKPSIKSQVLIAIITGLFVITGAIISSPHWFKVIFPEKYVEEEIITPKKIDTVFTINEDTLKEEEEIRYYGTEDLRITRLQICPINFNLPNYFFVEITNKGTKKLVNVNLTIDFGKASYTQIEYSPEKNITFNNDSLNKFFAKFQCEEINRDESIYIYALLTQPSFNRILIDGPNLTFSKEYTYMEYLDSEKGSESEINGWTLFLYILFGGILLI